MKLTLKHAGGLAAGIRRPPRVLETTSLSVQNAHQLLQLVAAAIAEHSPEKQSPTPSRDGMSYTLTVDMDGSITDLRGSDGAMTASFAKLLDCFELCHAEMDSK